MPYSCYMWVLSSRCEMYSTIFAPTCEPEKEHRGPKLFLMPSSVRVLSRAAHELVNRSVLLGILGAGRPDMNACQTPLQIELEPNALLAQFMPPDHLETNTRSTSRADELNKLPAHRC